jgi:vanillate O-demethylase monooxygenase subunit
MIAPTPPELAHWHPVGDSRKVRRKPVPVRLLGRDLVLFRDAAGRLGALDDRCPHRHLRLSAGAVEGERLVCAYHGWSYTTDGEGHCPATPGMQVSANAYDVREAGGLVWVKERGDEAPFPRLDFDGYRLVCTLRRRFDAPLDPVIDNFADDEHTAVVHRVFGYDPRRMPEVRLELDADETTVRSWCGGPHKRVPRAIAPLFGIYGGDHFVIEWTFHFSPLHAVFDMSWIDPATGDERGFRDKVDVFFVPVDDGVTELVYRQMTTMKLLGTAGFNVLVRPLTTLITELEVRVDQHIMRNLADTSADLSAMRLGRLDRSLGLVRSRLNSIYRSRAVDVGEIRLTDERPGVRTS